MIKLTLGQTYEYTGEAPTLVWVPDPSQGHWGVPRAGLRLVYLGSVITEDSRDWYVFALAEEPDKPWCQIQTHQLNLFEEVLT
jgi:hypothetical protein